MTTARERQAKRFDAFNRATGPSKKPALVKTAAQGKRRAEPSVSQTLYPSLPSIHDKPKGKA